MLYRSKSSCSCTLVPVTQPSPSLPPGLPHDILTLLHSLQPSLASVCETKSLVFLFLCVTTHLKMWYWSKRRILKRRNSNHWEELSKRLDIISPQGKQIKIILRSHLTPIRMAKINKPKESPCYPECWVRGRLIHCCAKLIQLPSVSWFLRKMTIELCLEPAIKRTCT